MRKDASSPASAIDEREKMVDKFIFQAEANDSANTTSQEPEASNSNATESKGSVVVEPREKRNEGVVDKTESLEPNAKKSGKGTVGNRVTKKKTTLTEHPAYARMLSKSKVQKTLRFPPLLMVEYEKVCEAVGCDPDFNSHMNEALELWLDRSRRKA